MVHCKLAIAGHIFPETQRTDNDLSSMDPNRSGLSSLKPSNNERERNLTDADKEFIAEIEEYIKNLVKHVNQGLLHFRWFNSAQIIGYISTI